MVQWVEQADKL